MRRGATYTPSPTFMRPRAFTIILATIAFGLAAQGCLYAGARTVRDTGPRITAESTAFIEPGKTTVDWIIAAFGDPSSRMCTRDGAELLRYDCDVRTTEGSYVFMLIASSNNRIERSSWWFEVRDQVVMRFWSDKPTPVTVQANAAAAGAATVTSTLPASE